MVQHTAIICFLQCFFSYIFLYRKQKQKNFRQKCRGFIKLKGSQLLKFVLVWKKIDKKCLNNSDNEIGNCRGSIIFRQTKQRYYNWKWIPQNKLLSAKGISVPQHDDPMFEYLLGKGSTFTMCFLFFKTRSQCTVDSATNSSY